MPDSINANQPLPIRPGSNVGKSTSPLQTSKTPDGKSFKDVFAEQLKAVNDLQRVADQKQEDFALGRSENIEDVLDAVEKADLAFKTLMQVRNKLVEAYQEISRMRI